MPQLKAYHRPQSLAEALELLARKDVRTAVLAGGTEAVPQLEEADEVVDLQAIGLDGVAREGQVLSLGAMVRVQSLVEDGRAPYLLREMARREGPNTFRNQGTVGGAIVAADPESELLAALLVYGATVTVETTAGPRTLSLDAFLDDVDTALGGGLLTAVTLETAGETGHARVARTPADDPIVAAVARRSPQGAARLALCGVARRPILVDPAELDSLDPPGDFRGSAAYRREMASVLAGRALEQIGAR